MLKMTRRVPRPPRPSRLPAVPVLLLLALSAALLPSAASAQTRHCGTAIWMEKPPEDRRRQAARIAAPLLARRKAAAADFPVRILETPNFVFRYVLRGRNRAKTVPGDEALTALADSLYAASPLTGDAEDAEVYRQLEARGAPHPVYVRTMADLFESARAYYVDTLGMRAPREDGTPVYYGGAARPGKYPVSVADIGTAEPRYYPDEIYALTFPTGSGGMLMENDFLFQTELGPDGIPTGKPIRSQYRDSVVHDYAAEWELGLKVTVYHELYHGVQFAYTPDENDFHLWYESSATGMEELKAPEVDDYLQYLPRYMQELGSRGMFGFAETSLSRYGNAVFLVFLAHDLGRDFEPLLWGILAENGNRLPAALAEAFRRRGTTSQEVYARFAAQLAFAGRAAENPLPAFSPDLPRWPSLPVQDSVDLVALGDSAYVFPHQLPPMSMRALALGGAGASGRAAFLTDSVLRTVVARLGADSSAVDISRSRIVPLDIRGEGGQTLAVFVNGTLETRANARPEIRILTSRVDSAVYAYPNPLGARDGELLFSRVGRPSRVEVFGEDGSLVRDLEFAAAAGLWSWDLTDRGGRRVRPGIYYYRVDAGALRPVLVR